jgi:hypothetical protein
VKADLSLTHYRIGRLRENKLIKKSLYFLSKYTSTSLIAESLQMRVREAHDNS